METAGSRKKAGDGSFDLYDKCQHSKVPHSSLLKE